MAATTMAGSKQYVFSNISAEFSKDHDLFGSQDPYIIFELGDDSVHTKVAKSGGVTPVWDEDYTLDAENSVGAQELKVVAYNKNTLLPDGLLGRGSLPLRDLSGDVKRVALLDKKGRHTGEVIFRARDSKGGAGTGTGMGTGARGMGTGARGTGMGTGTHGTGAGLGAGAAGAGLGAAAMGAGRHHDDHLRTNEGETHTQKLGEGVRQTTTTTQQPIGTGTDNREVCDSETFTRMEDRPVVRERKEYIMEHNPIEKEYVVETKFKGEREVSGGHHEHLGTEERVVQTTPGSKPCKDAPGITQQAVGGQRHHMGGTGVNTGATGGTGYNTSGQNYEEGHKPSMMEKVKDKLTPGTQSTERGYNQGTTGTGTTGTGYNQGTTGQQGRTL